MTVSMACNTLVAVWVLAWRFSAGLAHQSISHPVPVSREMKCHVSTERSCPGPCPKSHLRFDQNPNNPAITARRGQWIKVYTLKNNHRGGLSRWSLVHVRDMNDHSKHRENAFLYTCADIDPARCTRATERRDCKFDKQKLYYRHSIKIPAIYPNGVYVMGWVWYGGGEPMGQWGDFYDCFYIRIHGGPLVSSHNVEFRTGKTLTGTKDLCLSTVNRIGVCRIDPCPGGYREAYLTKPAEFVGKDPKPIPATRFANPYTRKKRASRSPVVKSITIRSADIPTKVYRSSYGGKFHYFKVYPAIRLAVTCEVTGDAWFVTFFINGKPGRTDHYPPYTMSGEYNVTIYGKRVLKYASWKFKFSHTWLTLSCRALGFDGTESWKTIELALDI